MKWDIWLGLSLALLMAIGVGIYIRAETRSHREFVVRRKSGWLGLFAIAILAPLAAHAQTAVDPTGLLSALSAIPAVGPYLVYIPILIAMCKLVTVAVPPPAAGSKLIGLYNIISAIGLNLGNARNAAPAGMMPEVRDKALASAKVTAAAPELAVVAPALSPSGTAVIVNEAAP